MGIPIGKLALYTACAGLPPWRCVPVTLDVGTNTVNVRNDPLYLGRCSPRLEGEEYDTFVDEFVTAVTRVFPDAVLQFEDFNNASAFRLLAHYRTRLCCFNDDIQGTGAMGLAGLYAAERITKRKLPEERVLFFGAGEACLGIGSILFEAMQKAGLSKEQAHSRCLFIDSKGMVVTSRTDLPPVKRAFAQERPAQPDLASAILAFHPTVLIGASGCAGAFTRAVVEAMVAVSPQPVIFALSNPSSKAECTAQQAYTWSDGHVLFASGSPFEPIEIEGRTHAPGQANNSYVFPGFGLGLLVCGAQRVSDEMFFAAANALSSQVTESVLEVGRIYPRQAQMRLVAHAVATAVVKVA
jgi:malate dehydrogenase (oxaloacetate-decarboxylating)(NADP+)